MRSRNFEINLNNVSVIRLRSLILRHFLGDENMLHVSNIIIVKKSSLKWLKLKFINFFIKIQIGGKNVSESD